MSIAGWLFLIVSWGIIVYLNAFCLLRLLELTAGRVKLRDGGNDDQR